MGLFKSQQAAKIAACYSHFEGCYRVYPYVQKMSI